MGLASEMTQPRLPLPAWIETLADLVAANILPIDPLAPVGCHVTRADEAWEITLFVSDTEIVGGAGDGLRRPSRFEFDMMPLLCLFAEIDACTWQSATKQGVKVKMWTDLKVAFTLSGRS